MVSVFLIISSVVLSGVILGVSVLLLIQFGHPDDRNVAWFPKIITILGLYLASATVLSLCFDVANARGTGGGLRIDLLWQIIFISDALMLVIVLPYAFFFYESDEDPLSAARQDVGNRKVFVGQCGNAIKMTCGFVTIFVLLLLILYFVINKALIPVNQIRVHADFFEVLNTTDTSKNFLFPGTCGENGENCVFTSFDWRIQVTFPIYVITVISFFGWFLFSIFAGIGLVALPVDLINEYRTRPIPISKEEYLMKKKDLGKRAQTLLEVAKEFQNELKRPSHRSDRRSKRKDQQFQTRLEAGLYLLNNQLKSVNQAYVDRGGNPLWYWFKLFLGFFTGFLSITWFLHIVLFVFPANPPTTFLNRVFIELETFIPGFPLFGIFAFGVYSMYLLWAAIKGLFRMGLGLPYLIKIYPMEINNTMMNAFLFNTWLILLFSVPVLQFCATAFPVYARLTQVDVIFGSQVRYLEFFKYFFAYDVFIWILVVFMFFGFLIMYMFPRDKAAEIDERMKRIASGKDDDDD